MDTLSDEPILKLCDDVMVTNNQYHSRASSELLIKHSVAQISHQPLNFVYPQRIKLRFSVICSENSLPWLTVDVRLATSTS